MKRRGRLSLATLLLALTATAACDRGAVNVPLLRVGHALHDHHAPLFVAASNSDYFREHGGVYLRAGAEDAEYELVAEGRVAARVRLGVSTGGQELVRRLAEDQFDLAFGGFSAFVEAIDRGEPLRMVAPVMTGGAGLVIHPRLPARTWDEFTALARARERPLRIGYAAAVSLQGLLFEEALTAEGLSYSDRLDAAEARVVLVNLHGTGKLIAALENGLVDGFVAMQPYLAMAQEQGAGKLVTSFADLPRQGGRDQYPCCALAARSAALAAQGPAVELLLELFLRAARYVAEDPERAAPVVAAWLGGSAEVERRSLPTIEFTTEFDAAWDRGARAWVSAMRSRGLLTGRVSEAYQRDGLAEELYDLGAYRRARSRL